MDGTVYLANGGDGYAAVARTVAQHGSGSAQELLDALVALGGAGAEDEGGLLDVAGHGRRACRRARPTRPVAGKRFLALIRFDCGCRVAM